MWCDVGWLLMNMQLRSDSVDSRVNNGVNITVVDITKTLVEPSSTQHHLTCAVTKRVQTTIVVQRITATDAC